MANDSNPYEQRIRAVVDFIDDHLGEELTLDRLCKLANFSKFHFHRQFRHYAGLTVSQLVQLKRLTRASYRLVLEPQTAITAIAFDAGFENSESFSRAFKQLFQQTPTEFRRQPFSEPWLAKTTLPPQLGGTFTMQVTIVNFPETKVALLQHRGLASEKMQTISKFIEWRRARGHTPQNSVTYNILYDDTNLASAEEFRFDICGAIDEEVEPNPQGVKNAFIPGGRCAVVRHLGSSDNIDVSVRYLYRDWLPTSGEELRDFPCFLHRVALPSQVSDKDVITDIYLPLK